MKKKLIILILIIVATINIRLWMGVYIHDEFGSRHIFIKHRPIWKWEFNSPIGLTDIKFEELSSERQQEQLLWDEFVWDRGMSR